MSTPSTSYLAQLWSQLIKQVPFAYLNLNQQDGFINEAKLIQLELGQTLISPSQLPDRIYLVISGQVRLLIDVDGDISTLTRRGSGQFLGWASLLRGGPCEWISACETTVVLALPSQIFLEAIKTNADFSEWFSLLVQPQESYHVANLAIELMPQRFVDWKNKLAEQVARSEAITVSPGVVFKTPVSSKSGMVWCLSTECVPDLPVGSLISDGQLLPINKGYKLPYRLIGLPTLDNIVKVPNGILAVQKDLLPLGPRGSTSLEQLGVLEADNLKDDDIYPVLRGRGVLDEAMAVCEMMSLTLRVPFRRDSIQKILEDQFRRNKSLTLELLGGLAEGLGLRTQLGSVEKENLNSLEAPALVMFEGTPVIIFRVDPDALVVGNPRQGLQKIPLSDFQKTYAERIPFALPRRIGTTPTSRFGWGWFTPLLGKYKKSLILVFVSSLLAQLFGLAIPLLIQQIIDKVLSQGNLSSLNVIGTLMIVLAIFQGCLMVLRTYIFVDTTDRMDLALGSAVIDRLLSLPLNFFEKRPVGELSQRIGELNNIRSFLTGTALVSVLNIIFASLYLIVMLIYSPLLSVVALSTLPLYLILILGSAPLYRMIIRKRAVAQAKTQSHLNEVLGGIQTVKAQHFELTARWKWQDRYRDFVSEGFKGVVLGTTTGQIGSFLNQLSSLLVLWVGMWLVLEGELTLGMLIAFRIISGNVTGPLLQLSGLYQGFQKVQVSMERLSDILDQNPELGKEEDIGQITMPPIKGDIRFENVKFRFGKKGPFQVEDVNLSIPAGSFVGVVGQSGSGKSTLMKLLPRLYDPNSGRIFIDDYDIGKIELSSLRRQIGIVPQDSLLFEGTIAENISLNDPQATNESIIEAAKLACAHDFIMSLGQGYATQLSERGGNLSGGQRQRIAIARTIISNPQLLIMDEATSALDYNTERQLCLNLQRWAEKRTVLFITHRLSTIKSSDLILVMHEGSLVEQGTHAQLLMTAERYAALFKQQGD